MEDTTQRDTQQQQIKSFEQLDEAQSSKTFDAIMELANATSTENPEVSASGNDTVPESAPVGTTSPVSEISPPSEDGQSAATESTDGGFYDKVNAIEPTKGAHPNVLKGIESLRSIAGEEHEARVKAESRAAELEKKAQEYEEKLKSPPLPDEVQKKLAAYDELQREIDIRNSPEFQEKYIKGIDNLESDILRSLSSAGVPEGTLEWIKANGGALKISQSTERASDKLTYSDWFQKELLSKLPPLWQKRVINKLDNAIDLSEGMQREVYDSKSQTSEKIKVRQENMRKEFESARDAALEEAGTLGKPVLLKDGSSPEERKNAEQHNQLLKQSAEKYQEWMRSSRDPKVAATILVKAAQSFYLMEALKNRDNTIKALKDKYEKVRSAGSTSRAGNQTVPSAAPATGSLMEQYKKQVDPYERIMQTFKETDK